MVIIGPGCSCTTGMFEVLAKSIYPRGRPHHHHSPRKGHRDGAVITSAVIFINGDFQLGQLSENIFSCSRIQLFRNQYAGFFTYAIHH